MKIHILHDFVGGAWGGGNQFLKALRQYLMENGLYADHYQSADTILVNSKDHLDIKKAIKTLNSLKQYNYSQGVVVRNKKIVFIEGKGGTKKLLEKSKNKKFRNDGVLVKFPKKKQDLRVDLPTIGLKTFKQSKAAGLKGIVVKSKQHIFLDKNKCISFANKNKMFISVK